MEPNTGDESFKRYLLSSILIRSRTFWLSRSDAGRFNADHKTLKLVLTVEAKSPAQKRSRQKGSYRIRIQYIGVYHKNFNNADAFSKA